jgi:predicted membrane protein
MTRPGKTETTPSRLHSPSLASGVIIMLVGTLYPPLMTNAAGQADHWLSLSVFWAMSAGLVRGVGFVPRTLVWRCLFSGWASAAALALAVFLKLLH